MHRIEAHDEIGEFKIPKIEETAPEPPTPEKPKLREKFKAPFFLTFIISLVTWLVLSGKFDLFHISLGVVS